MPLHAFRTLRCLIAAAAAIVLVAACGDPTEPGAQRVQLAAVGGDRQFAETLATLDEPLQVLVTEQAGGDPVKDVQVTWRVVHGAGTLTPASSTSDALGVARTTLRLGPRNRGDTIRVEATAARSVGPPAIFEAHVVRAPTIETVTPAAVRPGDAVTITGTGFLPSPADNTVLFGGVRGTVTSAQADRLVVTAPRCLHDRTVDVRVQLGQAASPPFPVQTSAPAADALHLDVGDVATVTGADIDCVRLAAADPAAAYLVIAQSATDVLRVPVPFRLLGNLGGAPLATVAIDDDVHRADDWELALRARERAFLATGAAHGRVLLPDAIVATQLPRIGDRREFNVLNAEQKTTRITAEVRAITARAVLYVDRDAPANGFTQLELENLGALFDDPIYGTVTNVFGVPTDVDGNERITILFTPRVNALTKRGEDGFIAGYFYGCDLVTAARCAATNRAEIFYSMVPDPQGMFSDVRTKGDVMRTVPGILAHEFQHMIHYGRKDGLDVLWLSEALAHAAEDLVGRVFRARGDNTVADGFQVPNFVRAHRYLMNTSAVALLGEDSPGTLELRGGAWLFLTFLASHYGGDDLLRRVTASSLSGVRNVTTETGQPWNRLLADFAVALWADEAPELFAVAIDTRYTFPNINLRQALGRFQGGFALRPPTVPLQDFAVNGSVAASAQAYVLLQAPAAGTPPFSLSLTARLGGALPTNVQPQLIVLRVR